MSTESTSGLRRLIGFGFSGGVAFLVDVGITKGLNTALGLPWSLSRIIAIAGAMVVAWICHRNLTFAVKNAPTLQEFGRYAAVGWSAALLNYVIFLGVLWLWPWLDASIAIGISSVIAMAYSYLGMRMGVFERQQACEAEMRDDHV